MSEASQRKQRTASNTIVMILFIAAPVLVSFVIWVVTGFSPWNADGWNTIWNDEGGYWRCIRLMHMFGVPQGVTGFDENAGRFLAYGPYNVITYIPYFLVTFLTGWTSHNYIYAANIVMAVLANFLFVLLARPDRKRSLWLFLFEMSYLIYARYIWSGMVEESYCFFMVVLAGLIVCYLRKLNAQDGRNGLTGRTGTVLLIAMIFMIVVWSLMRPYYLPLLILPFLLALFRFPAAGRIRKILLGGICIGVGGVAFKLYLYLNDNCVARYFFTSTPVETLRNLFVTGSVSQIVLHLTEKAGTAMAQVWRMLLDLRWQGIVTLLVIIEWGILLFMMLYSVAAGRKNKKKNGLVIVEFSLLLSSFLALAGILVLYQGVQLHRMMLAFTVMFEFVIVSLCARPQWSGKGGERSVSPALLEICIVVMMALIMIVGNDTHAFYPPQKSSESIAASERSKTEKELAAVLPHVSNQTPWDNTVAKEVETHGLQYTFMMPAYVSFNICQREVLYNKIDSGTLKSRYVVLPQDSKSVKLCDQKGYTRLWEGYGHVLFSK